LVYSALLSGDDSKGQHFGRPITDDPSGRGIDGLTAPG